MLEFQTGMTRSVLVVYALFDRQVLFEILEHRPILNSAVKNETLNQDAGVFVCVRGEGVG